MGDFDRYINTLSESPFLSVFLLQVYICACYNLQVDCIKNIRPLIKTFAVKKIQKNLIFAIIVLAGIFLILEACQRVNTYYHYWRDVKKFKSELLEIVSPIDRREYVLKKGGKFTTRDGILYQINEKGLRGAERDYNKSFGTYRILMLGDSYLFGWGLEWDDTLPVILEKRFLDTGYDGKRCEVINAGVFGYNTAQELEFLKKEGVKYSPDAVIIYFIMNDLEPQWNAPRHPKYEYEYCASWFLDHLSRRLNKLISKITKNSEPFFVTYRNRQNTEYLRALDKEKYKWNSCRAALSEFVVYCQERNIKLYLIIVPDISQNLNKYALGRIHKEVSGAVRSNAVPVLDLFETLKEIDSKKLWVSKDDAHPNRYANELIADKIHSFLMQNKS